MLNCVHSSVSFPHCDKPAFTRRTHGWLCIGHYKYQQEHMPAKPRLSQPVWRGYKPIVQSDEAVIADIIATDKKAIASGKIVEIIHGALDPVIIRVLES